MEERLKNTILYFRSWVLVAIAALSLSALATPSYTVERNGAKAVVQLSYDATERVLTARIQRDGQPDHVYAHSLAQLKLEVSIGTERIITVQGHTPTMAGSIETADLSVGEETTPSQIWHLAAARRLRTTLGADIDILRALPNRELMNVFIGPYVLATGDIERVLTAPSQPYQVTTPATGGGRFRAQSNSGTYEDLMEMPFECAAYAACYWGCVAGGGGWIDCGPYCHNQQGC